MILRQTRLQGTFSSFSGRLLTLALFTGLLLLSCYISPVHAEPIPDVRVLIDISGSMKKNDPKNLRESALRMLVGLMPDGTRSGVWTFGQYVNMQVKLGKVDKAWKQEALAAAGKINSNGLYTNIEAALKKSTVDWTRPDPAYKRSLILLTDGMVDISKNKAENAASQQRILRDILPRLEAADVAVHTIALSPNADKDLLSALSAATKGAFVQVDNADSLQRIFLKLFETSVSPDTLPLQDNKFTVDKQVSDFTVLVFLAKDSPSTKLTTPDGMIWNQRAHPDNVSWYHDKGYDLITVKKPDAGEWQLQAKLDPDNRVMIVTNLRLKVDKLPNNLLLGDKFDVRARLLENGKTVGNQNLLSKTQFTLQQTNDNVQLASTALKDDGQTPDVLKGDGVYSVEMPAQEKAGEFDLIVSAKSLTFTRELHHSLHVHASPAVYSVTQPGSDQPFTLNVHPHAGLIRPETISMQLRTPDGKTQILSQVGDLEWQAQVPATLSGQTLGITIVGKRYNDRDLKMEFSVPLAVTHEPQPLSLASQAEKPAEAAPTTHEAKVEPAHAATPKPEEKPPAHDEKSQHEDKTKGKHAKPTAKPKQKKGFNWTMVIILVVLVNLIVILGGWFGYRFMKKRKAKALQDVEAGTAE